MEKEERKKEKEKEQGGIDVEGTKWKARPTISGAPCLSLKLGKTGGTPVVFH